MISNNFFSIIVVFRNEAKKLSSTLANVAEQTYPKESFELICVDDASSDNSIKIAKGFTDKIIRFDKNVGISRARNEAIKMAKGNLILFLDGHTLFPKILLQELEKLFREYPQVKGICVSYKSKGTDDYNVIRDIRRKTVFKKNDKKLIIDLNNFTAFSIAVGALYKEAFIEGGYFPAGFENSAGEDTFLQIKMHNLGYKLLYAPQIETIHDADLTRNNLFFNKLAKEARATSNILALGGKENLKIPYLNFFLDYPSSLLFLIILFFIFRHIFLLFLISAELLNYFLRLSQVLLIKESLPHKIETIFYLLLKDAVQVIYLPYWILKERTPLKFYPYILKTLIKWEISKWLSLNKLF